MVPNPPNIEYKGWGPIPNNLAHHVFTQSHSYVAHTPSFPSEELNIDSNLKNATHVMEHTYVNPNDTHAGKIIDVTHSISKLISKPLHVNYVSPLKNILLKLKFEISVLYLHLLLPKSLIKRKKWESNNK